MKTEIEQLKFDQEKHTAELNSQWEERMSAKEEDLAIIFNHKLALMTEKLRQAEDMCQLYHDQLEMRLSTPMVDTEPVLAQKTSKMGQAEYSLLKAKRVPEEVSALSMRINRALSQTNPSAVRIEEKLRQIRGKCL
jgi:hypothetical protein